MESILRAQGSSGKINTQIMKVLDRTHIQTEVYERGAGYTLASGSGCCAAAAAAYRLGLTDPKMIVQMPGGTLELEIREDATVLMTGDVGYVGSIKLGNHFTEQLRRLTNKKTAFIFFYRYRQRQSGVSGQIPALMHLRRRTRRTERVCCIKGSGGFYFGRIVQERTVE